MLTWIKKIFIKKYYMVVYIIAGAQDKQLISIVHCNPMDIVKAVKKDCGNDGINFKTIVNVLPL